MCSVHLRYNTSFTLKISRNFNIFDNGGPPIDNSCVSRRTTACVLHLCTSFPYNHYFRGREREREGGREGGRERERESEREREVRGREGGEKSSCTCI